MEPAYVTVSRARQLLDMHGLHTRRRFGQHLLVDPNTVRRIVRIAGIGPDETVLEVGPGIGSLTVALASVARRVVAIEIDERLAGVLREVVGSQPTVEIVIADAMRADVSQLVSGPARLVANLPYNIATPLFARMLDEVPEIHAGLVMVQRELGERWTAPPGSRTYGAISVKVAYHARTRLMGDVPSTVFLPAPKVSSVLVSFERRPPPVEVDDPGPFLRFVESAFAQRRKTIRNAVQATIGRDRADAALRRAGIDPSRRPEQLGIDMFALLYRSLR